MKKRIILMLVLAVVVLSMIGLVACNNSQVPADPNAPQTPGDPSEQPAQTMTLVLLKGDYVQEFTVTLSELPATSKGLIAVLDLLQSQGKLTYEAQDSTYGKFLTRVGELRQDEAAGTYLSLYTTVEKDKDVSAYATTLTYKDITLTSSGVGAESMTMEKDCIVVITLFSYNG